MFARSFLGRPAGASLRVSPPTLSDGCRKLVQYRGPFSAKSRELTLSDRSEPLNSFGFFHLSPSAPPMALTLLNLAPSVPVPTAPGTALCSCDTRKHVWCHEHFQRERAANRPQSRILDVEMSTE